MLARASGADPLCGHPEHPVGEVDTEHMPARGRPGSVDRDRTVSAADVDHPIVRAHGSGGHEPGVESADRSVVERRVLGPVVPLVAVPRGQLALVARADHAMERTLNRIWPRARSRLYEEPKKLVQLGLATARKDKVGKRPRTIYTITPQGRAALTRWLRTPGSGPSLEFEQLAQLFFADHGTRDDALATLRASQVWAAEQRAVFVEAAQAYLDGKGPFPERLTVNALGARFLVDFYDLVERWAGWATDVVEQWPEDPGRAEPNLDVVRSIVAAADARRD